MRYGMALSTNPDPVPFSSGREAKAAYRMAPYRYVGGIKGKSEIGMIH